MSKVFKPRFTAPSASDKNFLRYDKGGYNYCVEIGTTKSVLPNCTGYAWGRFLELIGKFHDLSRGNAEVWWGTNQGRKAFKFGQKPKLGAIVCWKQGIAGNNNDGLGHVAVVEQINADGSIVTSNSAYGDANRRFYLQTLKPPYIYASGFDLQGFIYPPTDYVAGKEEAPEVKPSPKPPVASGRQIGSTVVVNGKLFRNSSASSIGSVVHRNKKATIDKIVDGAKAPFHVTGSGISGWGNESLFDGSVYKSLKVGDNVKIKPNAIYQGSDRGKPVSKTAYDKPRLTIDKIDGTNARLSEIKSWIALKDLELR